jgi:integrase
MKRRGEQPHFRAVDLADAPGVFQKLKAQASASTALAAWALMVLTAVRPSEALNAQWDEIDQGQRLWAIPASRMKSARAHVVPLSAEALAIVERQRSVRSGEAVFPGRSGSPLSYSSFADAPMKAGIDVATAHGWRSVFRDWAGDIGDVPRDLAESALAHSLSGVEASYRRRTAVERRREVMESYGRWLNGEGVAQVIPFRQGRQ